VAIDRGDITARSVRIASMVTLSLLAAGPWIEVELLMLIVALWFVDAPVIRAKKFGPKMWALGKVPKGCR